MSIRNVIVFWCVAEVLAFALAVHLFGLGPTLLAEFGIGVLGFVLLKRTGTAAIVRLRAAFRDRLAGPAGNGVDEGLAVVGAVALIVPGFLSDIVGLALLVRPMRDKVAAILARGGVAVLRRRADAAQAGRPSGPQTIDLAPGEWRSGDGQRPVRR